MILRQASCEPSPHVDNWMQVRPLPAAVLKSVTTEAELIDLGRIRHVALEAGLLNRTRPRAFPGGAAPRPQSTATRRAGALTSLTRARFWVCTPTDSQEDPHLAVLVRRLARYCESELTLYPPPALIRIERRDAWLICPGSAQSYRETRG